jgi:integrase
VLRAALQDAVDEELLSRNVARLVQLRVTDERRVRSFSRDEALRFLQAAEKHRLYALWAVALAMGLRRGEALGLAWADVDLDGGRLTVRQALHRVDGQLRLDPVKTDASVAVLPIPASLVSILSAHRRRQREERIAAGADWRDTGLVFTTAHGGFIEPRNANRMFHNVCTRAKVPQLRVHDLRHSCATLLFTMGVQPATVQRILRHSSITVTTGTYVEVIEPLPSRLILLAANVEHSQAGIPQRLNLHWFGTELLVSGDDDQVSVRYSWYPLGIERAAWTFRDEWMADVNRVLTCCAHRESQAGRALVNVKPHLTGDGDHEPTMT